MSQALGCLRGPRQAKLSHGELVVCEDVGRDLVTRKPRCPVGGLRGRAPGGGLPERGTEAPVGAVSFLRAERAISVLICRAPDEAHGSASVGPWVSSCHLKHLQGASPGHSQSTLLLSSSPARK